MRERYPQGADFDPEDALNQPTGKHEPRTDVLPVQLAERAERAARNLERLQADRDLLYRLALQSYKGPEWDRFAETLAEYGVAVLLPWIYTGQIFAECAGVFPGGFDLPRFPRSADDAHELALETVATAIATFRDHVLIPGKWDPTRGASLTTYFVGKCKWQFPNIYRSWVREQNIPPDREAFVLELEVLMAETRAAPDFARTAAAARILVEISRLPAGHARQIELLGALGYTQAEVAEMFGTTHKAVRSRLQRWRKKRRNKTTEDT